jgi:hypothetical protein
MIGRGFIPCACACRSAFLPVARHLDPMRTQCAAMIRVPFAPDRKEYDRNADWRWTGTNVPKTAVKKAKTRSVAAYVQSCLQDCPGNKNGV